MQRLEQTLDSREVAAMVEKEHRILLRDIRRYCKQLGEHKIVLSDFFTESTYISAQNKIQPCYRITKKGCEFIAHKLTGTKGTIFTARYINRFHEMQDIISKQEYELPWFIREFNGRYIILERDFIKITGVDIKKHRLFYRLEYFKGGLDWNGWGWKCDNDKFKKQYGFDYGDNPCMTYFYPRGVVKALKILKEDKRARMNDGAYELLMNGLERLEKIKWRDIEVKEIESKVEEKKLSHDSTIQINIIMGNESKVI